MTAAETLWLLLIILLMAALLLGDLAATATRILDGFLILAAERFGDLGSAWRRLLAAVRTARAQWRG
jgi:hypothetical protein